MFRGCESDEPLFETSFTEMDDAPDHIPRVKWSYACVFTRLGFANDEFELDGVRRRARF